MARAIRVFRRALLIAISMLPIVAGSPAAALADCHDLLLEFNRALAAQDLAKVKQFEEKIAVDAECGSRLLEIQRRRTALELLVAQRSLTSAGSAETYRHLVEDADRPGVLWQAAVAVGEMRFKQRDFAASARAYQKALEIIKDRSKTPKPPPPATIEEVFSRASEAQMLAANGENAATPAVFVAAAKGRDGTIGGTMSASIRGFEPKVVPLPIRFVTASTQFTAVGNQAANELLTALREQRPSRIILIGHTDDRGGVRYNMRLSGRRAKAVAAFLRSNGITGNIITIAKGKSEPLKLADESGLTQEDVWALNRRVEWKRQ